MYLSKRGYVLCVGYNYLNLRCR